MRFLAVIEKSSKGFSAYLPDVPGCIATGTTQRQVEARLRKGVAMHLEELKAAGLDPIFLLAPTSTEQRMQDVGRVATGYVYYVSLKGVTGAGHLDTSAVAQAVPRIRKHVQVPVGVGFGIRDAATAQAVAQVADAVVIGSRIVQLLEEQTRDTVAAAGRQFIAEIRSALDNMKGATR